MAGRYQQFVDSVETLATRMDAIERSRADDATAAQALTAQANYIRAYHARKADPDAAKRYRDKAGKARG